jgi:hypothetical protein
MVEIINKDMFDLVVKIYGDRVRKTGSIYVLICPFPYSSSMLSSLFLILNMNN